MFFQTSLLWSEQRHRFRILNVELENIQVSLCLVEVDVSVNTGELVIIFLVQGGRKVAGFRARKTRWVDYCSRCREVAATGETKNLRDGYIHIRKNIKIWKLLML